MTTKALKAEVSAASMGLVMMALLSKSPNGYVTQAELEAEILAKLGHEFSASDRRAMRIGPRRTPRQK